MNTLIAQSALSSLRAAQEPLRLCAAFENQPARRAIEQFVAMGFYDAYAAQLTSFLPLLVHFDPLNKGAALGLGRARSPLFIEQYLSVPIEGVIHSNSCVKRCQIAELGNLFSLNQHATVPLFMTVAVALYQTDFRFLCFSGTEKVRAILRKYAVPFKVLCDAKRRSVG